MGDRDLELKLKDLGLDSIEREFVDHYCNHAESRFSHTKAAMMCGKSKNTASKWAKLKLSHQRVRDAIRIVSEHRSNAVGMTTEAWLQRTSQMAFANIDDFITVNDQGLPTIDLSECPPDMLAAIESLRTTPVTNSRGDYVGETVTLKMVNRLAALDMLGRFLNLFTSLEDTAEDMAAVMKALNEGVERAREGAIVRRNEEGDDVVGNLPN